MTRAEPLFEELLNEERSIRAKAQEEVRAYQLLLQELAVRIYPEGVDDGKRTRPGFMQGWSADEWRQFWRDYRVNFVWQEPGKDDENRQFRQLKQLYQETEQKVSRLLLERQAVETQLFETKRKLERLEAFSAAKMNPVGEKEKPIPDLKEVPEPYREAVLALRGLSDTVPPLAFINRFRTNIQRWPRKYRILYLMAHYGWSSRLELQLVLGLAEGLSSKSSTLRRVMVDLEESGLINREMVEILSETGEKNTLILLKLNPDGRRCCRLLGWEPVMPEEFSEEVVTRLDKFTTSRSLKAPDFSRGMKSSQPEAGIFRTSVL